MSINETHRRESLQSLNVPLSAQDVAYLDLVRVGADGYAGDKHRETPKLGIS